MLVGLHMHCLHRRGVLDTTPCQNGIHCWQHRSFAVLFLDALDDLSSREASSSHPTDDAPRERIHASYGHHGQRCEDKLEMLRAMPAPRKQRDRSNAIHKTQYLSSDDPHSPHSMLEALRGAKVVFFVVSTLYRTIVFAGERRIKS